MSKWIRVQERMPSNSVSVLVWCPDRSNKYTAYWRAPDWIHFGGGFGKTVEETVTHWMCTPDAPKVLTTEQQMIETIIETVQKIGRFPQWGDDLRPFARTLTGEIMHDLEESK